jgi:DNA-binding response OmpR family regulator
VTDKEALEEQSRTVLIIDDDAMGARLLVTLLELEDYTGFQPQDWDNPVVDVEAHRPSLVLIDVRLRSRSGFDVLEEVRAHPDPEVASTPVFMMSAEDYRIESQRAGADGFLHKPFDVNILFDVVRKKGKG